MSSTISGTVMNEFADASRIFVQNWTGDTIGSQTINEKYRNVLTNLTIIKTASRMTGIGADFNWSLGEFRVDKGQSSNPLFSVVTSAANEVNQELQALGRPIRFGRALG